MQTERIGDTDPKNRLRIVMDAEGNVMVQILRFGPQGTVDSVQVEFHPTSKGGKSPSTFDAFPGLIEAMNKDNRIGNISREVFNPPFDSEPE